MRLQLDEDGMLLWQAALHNCVMLQSQLGQPSLLDLFPLAINLLSNDLDMLGSITLILESYFVLDVNSILNVRPYLAVPDDALTVSHSSAHLNCSKPTRTQYASL